MLYLIYIEFIIYIEYMAKYSLIYITCVLLMSSMVMSLLLYSTRSYMLSYDYANLVPVWLYPANILAWFRVAILILAVGLAATRGGGWLQRIIVRTSWANAKVKLHSQVHIKLGLQVLTRPVLT